MAIKKITEGFYNCLQEDINKFLLPEADLEISEGTTYFCLDSGATYKATPVLDDPDFTYLKLIDIENKKNRKVNPTCYIQDLVNFRGKRIKIKNIVSNILSDINGYVYNSNNYSRNDVMIGNYEESSVTEQIWITKESFNNVCCLIWAHYGSSDVTLSSGDIVLKTSSGLNLYESPALDGGEFNVSDVIYTDDVSQGDVFEIEVKAGVECYFMIVDAAWLRPMHTDDEEKCALLFNKDGLYIVDDNFNKVENIFERYARGNSEDNILFGNISDTKYAYMEYKLKDIKVPEEDDYRFVLSSISAPVGISVTESFCCIAEILD